MCNLNEHPLIQGCGKGVKVCLGVVQTMFLKDMVVKPNPLFASCWIAACLS